VSQPAGPLVLFLPPNGFRKVEGPSTSRAVRTIDALWRAIGEICHLFSPQECENYFRAAGYGLT
jgi:hypothetical protein